MENRVTRFVFFPISLNILAELYLQSDQEYVNDIARAYNISNIVSYNELSVSARTFGMDDSFWNPFSIEMGEKINEVEVLQ